jgi:hypothetical protein
VATLLNIRDPVGALMIASRAFVVTTEKRYRKLTLEGDIVKCCGSARHQRRVSRE